MQRSVRSTFNHALEMAIQYANHLGLPVLVVFAIVTSYPGANERGFAFLFEGLSEVQALLAKRGICMIVREAKPTTTSNDPAMAVPAVVLDTCHQVRAPLLVMDRAYERLLRTWREHVSQHVACPVLMVESDVVVPVQNAGPRPLASAAALRKAHAPLLAQYLHPLPELAVAHPSMAHLPAFQALFGDDVLDMEDPHALLESLAGIDRSVPRVAFKRGGPTQAKLLLARFLRDRLAGYQAYRKEAAARHQSFLSPYLHFGHISPLYIALKVHQHTASSPDDRRRFCDELLTWREMAIHFVYHHRESYDTYDCLPTWAKDSLHAAATDPRSHTYTLAELDEGRTHDPLWNAAQEEMRATGYMNNYMRMLWAKGILAWTAEGPREAYRRTLLLNDKWFLDGRDCNGYLGVAWCFGMYDRPMPHGPVFGIVRRMTTSGARAKQDVDAYIAQVKALATKAKAGGARGELGVADAIYAVTPVRANIAAFFSPRASSGGAVAGSSGGAGSSSGGGGGKEEAAAHKEAVEEKEKKKRKITDFFGGGKDDR